MAVKFLGQFLLEKGLINKDQLLAALDAQRASNPLLGELAQACGWVIGLACDGATTAAIASAFLSMPDTACDDVLAHRTRWGN